jgi:hypothetical protein
MADQRTSGRLSWFSVSTRIGVLLALACGVLFMGPVQVAYAGTIVVTTAADTLDANGGNCAGLAPSDLPGPDGVTSLREAICAANTNPNADTIDLGAQTYKLTRLGVEDANVQGDLDVLATGGDLTLLGEGAAGTIIEGPGIVVDTDRVLHIDPAAIGSITVSISGVTIRNGFGGTYGGGIRIQGRNTVNITDCVLTDNRVSVLGVGGAGAIYNGFGGTLNITDSTLSDNVARGVVVGAKAVAGALYNGPECTANIVDSTISQNTVATVAGAGSLADGGAIFNLSGEVNLETVSILGNKASGETTGSVGRGGAIFNASAGTVILTDDTNVYGNEADLEGGGIFNDNSTLWIVDSIVSDNTASGGIEGLPSIGGGIANRNGGEATIEDSDVTINHALTPAGPFGEGDCGGIDNAGATLVISDTWVAGNEADDACGGICNTDDATVSIADSTLYNNQAAVRGGALCSEESLATITRCTLLDNGSDGIAGAIYQSEGTLHLTDSTLDGNGSWVGGGICAVAGTTYVTGCTLSDNWGGGIYEEDGTLYVTNSTLSGNRTYGDGGGILSIEGTTVLENATVTGNVADEEVDGAGDGGGIWNLGTGVVKLKNSIVAGNVDKGSEAPDCTGTIKTYGDNIVQDTGGCTLDGASTNITGSDAHLDALADNGGPTMTHALQRDSPALDAVADCTDIADQPITVDQRGVARPQRAACDIGAFELESDRAYLPLVLRKSSS